MLDAQSFCWFCHVVAHMTFVLAFSVKRKSGSYISVPHTGNFYVEYLVLWYKPRSRFQKHTKKPQIVSLEALQFKITFYHKTL